MVETAVFSIFHRQAVAADPVLVETAEASQPIHHQAVEEPPQLAQSLEPSAVTSEEMLPGAIELDPPALGDATVPPVLDTASWLDVPVDHDFIGLANPSSCLVSASFSSVDPVEITADSTGMYRPVSFRPAPWSGFAYDVAPDTRTGLVAGTRILTARGEIAVENLLPGDSAMALRGPALLPILWIGRCTAAEPPVMIEAGALGDQRPSRSLCVAADHPIFVDPVPVAARRLVNGTTIRKLAVLDAELFHVDVGRQEVLFAQNVPLASTLRPSAGTVE